MNAAGTDARDLAGATVVVTGASSGTGAEAARLLHELGARVVVVGRDPARTAAVAAPMGACWFVADFADFHPGIIASDFGRYLGMPGRIATILARPFLTSPREAGRRLVHLATTQDAVGGRYYDRTRPAEPSPLVGDPELAAAVWDDARRRLGPPPG